ncbi:uncharacterized protein C8A04DRAFT_10651 [Dichotomopilus funicola]|uniref:Uncharacterized protein n=1 Tax=Dichotomopilus funicola TaxID=1934379 RepID=A0AAN6V647_9PEZI|nr:hypothetical protein C8A04DRAFT_10651 [Dichotomopilus funicola]
MTRPPTYISSLSLTLALITLLLALTTPTHAAPTEPWYEKYHQRRVTVPQSYYEGLALRRQVHLNPDAVRDVRCVDTSATILLHDEHAASLAICSSIAGRRHASHCQTLLPQTTEGRVGSAVFRLEALDEGQQQPMEGISRRRINVSKEAWMGCVAAAREQCPQGGLEGRCVGVATGGGDVWFSLGGV